MKRSYTLDLDHSTKSSSDVGAGIIPTQVQLPYMWTREVCLVVEEKEFFSVGVSSSAKNRVHFDLHLTL